MGTTIVKHQCEKDKTIIPVGFDAFMTPPLVGRYNQCKTSCLKGQKQK
jgi:hypothetical protein